MFLIRLFRKIKYFFNYIIVKAFYYDKIEIKGKVIFRTVPIIEDFKKLKICIGNNVVLKKNVIIRGGGLLKIGENTHIGAFSIIGCNSKVIIGNNCMIADCVTIRDTNHNFSRIDIPMNQQGISTKEVIIEDDVWIGHGAIILKGVKIGKGSIVGAGSVVTKNVPPFSVVAGNPGEIIKRRINGKVP